MKTKEIVLSAVFMALIVVATIFVSLPLAFGYVHLGDAIIVVACFLLKPKKAIPISLLGSALADLILGYYIYIPATIIVKGLFATCFSFLIYEKPTFARCAISLVLGTLIIFLGYFIFEVILYGFGTAIVNVPFNALQGGVCSLVGGAVIQSIKKISVVENIRK